MDVATQALPPVEAPTTKREKLKSRMRRAVLRKFVLKMMLGDQVTEWVYPWIHPKARARHWSTM